MTKEVGSPRDVLEIVFRDLPDDYASMAEPTPLDGDFGPGCVAFEWIADSGGMDAVVIDGRADVAVQICSVAGQVQERVIEDLWSARRSPVWPACPTHGSHPLVATIEGEVAVWTCPDDRAVIAPVGTLR